MGLFGNTKKEQRQESLPPLKFPELPSTTPMEFPAYQQSAMKEAAAIKQAVMPREMQRQQEEMPLREQKAEQPLFIKVEAYKEVVDTIAVVKAKLVDAGNILDELTKLKEEEDRELSSWHSDLAAIKEKLMLVDQKLFEQ